MIATPPQAPSHSSNADFEPILIVGHPRSGTTLLATILNRHSLVAVPPETSFFHRAFRHKRREAARDGRHAAFMAYLRQIPNTLRYDENSVSRAFAEGPATAADLFRCLLTEHTNAERKSRCADKTPLHLDAVPMLLAAYPRARVVCLMRDGRDVVRSCLRAPFYPWEPAWWHCMSWCQAAARAAEFQRRYPEHFLICRYESLVETPDDEVRRVDRFLGLPFEPAQLAGDGSDAVRLHRDWWWMERAGSPPDRGRVLSWKRSADPHEIRYFTALMNPWLAHFGYETYWSPSVGGSAATYIGYRAMSLALRPTRLSHRITGGILRKFQKLAGANKAPQPETLENRALSTSTER